MLWNVKSEVLRQILLLGLEVALFNGGRDFIQDRLEASKGLLNRLFGHLLWDISIQRARISEARFGTFACLELYSVVGQTGHWPGSTHLGLRSDRLGSFVLILIIKDVDIARARVPHQMQGLLRVFLFHLGVSLTLGRIELSLSYCHSGRHVSCN